MNRQEAVERAENDPEIKSVVVTADGWIAVTDEETAEVARTLFERSLHAETGDLSDTDSDHAGGQP